MTTYLLTWNPELREWAKDEVERLVESWQRGGTITATWSTGSTTTIRPGDHLVWIRLGDPSRGVFATGRATSTVYQRPNLDQERAGEGASSNVVDVEFDELLNPWTEEILSLVALQEALSKQEWSPQASADQIDVSTAIELEAHWQRHLAAHRRTLRLADSLAHVRTSLRTYDEALRAKNKATEYSIRHPTYFVYDSARDRFAPAKWCGLRGMTPETYVALQQLQRTRAASRGFDGSRTRNNLEALTGLDFVVDAALLSKVASAFKNSFGANALSNRDLKDLRFMTLPARTLWWVNQDKIYGAEFEGGLIWAAQKDKKGKTPLHHKNVSAVEKGDVIAHYAGGAVRAISIAETDGYVATRPASITTEEWQRHGWQVNTAYHVLSEPVPLLAISAGLSALNLSNGPINPGGGVNQGYLYRLSPAAMEVIARAAGSSLPDPIAEVVRMQPRKPTPSTPMDDLNVIYYGPPGTGKTFVTARRAVEIIDGEAPAYQGALMRRFSELRELGQVAFVTFHQSYSYEEFVEGIRPVISGFGEPDSGRTHIEYECRRGAFRNICSLAAGSGARSTATFEFDADATRVWKMSLGNTRNPDDAALYDDAIEEGLATLGYGKGLDFTGCDDAEAVAAALRAKDPGLAENDYSITAVNRFKNLVKVGDLIVVSDGNTKFRAIGRVTGEYQYLPRERHQQSRSVDWLVVLEDSVPRERILNKNFSQATIYRLQKSVLKLEAFRDILNGDASSSPRKHVLIIDEINRGNIAKILGELITLIEPDKRIGAPNEVRVKLPYSNDTFGVPANLHVIGTMNTADRSIAFIDTALRRRFRFEEMMPDSQVVRRLVGDDGRIEGIDIALLLDGINERVELLYDRDHTIGHAYFLKIQDLPGLRDTFVHRVIPLLQEYFYGDWTKVAVVLGCPYDIEAKTPKTPNASPLLLARRLALNSVSIDQDIEPGVRFSLNPKFLGASGSELATFFDCVLTPSGPAAAED